MEKCKESNLCLLDDTGRFMPCLATYFLKVSACLPVKVVYKGSFKCKKNYITWKNSIFEAIIGKQRSSVTNAIYVFYVIFECAYLIQLNSRILLKLATNGFVIGKIHLKFIVFQL